jgi:hypothetical protein
MSEQRWIVHLPTVLTSQAEALHLVAKLEQSLAHVSVIDFREATFSEEYRQHLRHRLHCNLPIGADRDGPRCLLPGGHDGPCAGKPLLGGGDRGDT